MGKRRLVLGALSLTVVGLTLTVILASRDSASPAAAQGATVSLTTAASPVGCATVTAQLSSDTSTVSPGSEWTFPKNSYVKVKANAARGCTLRRWTLDFGGGITFDLFENPSRFQISGDMTVTAHLTVPTVCTQTTLGQAPAQVPDLAKDCNILMAAKDALRGTGTLNWSADTAITGWDGVTVSGTPSRVTGLTLRLRGLTGGVPAKLGALSALGSLDLSWNKLTGSIPTTLGHLDELTSLSLSRTSLGGSIPPELGALAKLEQLSLSQSFLRGAIPAELGNLTSLKGLYLYQNRLTGSIPPELAGLSSLERLFLGQNTFTGCLPRALRRVANNDLATLGIGSCALPSVSFSYDTYDTTGAVATAGSYALLAEGEDGTMKAVTTYEALRDGTATMLKIHTSDAADASRAEVYRDVENGDLIEWNQASDCFVRYRVTGASAAGEGARFREFSVRPETYAWQSCKTGSLPAPAGGGASGATSTAMTITVGTALPLARLGGTQLAGFAVIHGPWQVTPYVQSQPGSVGSPPASVVLKASVDTQQAERFRSPANKVGERITSLEEARRLPYWREPALPAGWTFSGLYVGGGHSRPGYEAYWESGGVAAVVIRGVHATHRYYAGAATWVVNDGKRFVTELRTIAGRPAIVTYSPVGAQHRPTSGFHIAVYDASTDSVYEIEGLSGSLGLRGTPAAYERLLAIMRSLFEGANPR